MGTFARLADITGQTFERLTVVALAGKYRNGSAQWLCRCKCGAEVVAIGQKLRNGRAKSCGCLNREVAKARRTTHGDSGTRLFRIWTGMRTRCMNPNAAGWPLYGGRGIGICAEWQDSFVTFRDWALSHGYAEGLTIERKDVNGNYNPGNCCWATRLEQAQNKRNNARLRDGRLAVPAAASNGISAAQYRQRRRGGMSPDEAALTPRMRIRHLLADGRLAVEVAVANGISPGTFNTRVRAYGWSPERAASTPVRGS